MRSNNNSETDEPPPEEASPARDARAPSSPEKLKFEGLFISSIWKIAIAENFFSLFRA